MRIMRAGKMTDLKKLRYPLLASYKLDGVRARIIGATVMSKSDKRIPNLHCQKLFGTSILNGVDAELVVGPPNLPTTMATTMSGVMSRDGEPDVKLYVFDDFMVEGGFSNRKEKLRKRIGKLASPLRKLIVILEQRLISDEFDLLAMEQEALDDGYEGLMLRSLNGPYKGGTSTESEGYLLKLKRFADAEARVIGFEEEQHNANEKAADGRRTSHKAGKIGKGTLGALRVVGINGPYKGVEFNIGTGFDAEMRKVIWKGQDRHINAIVKFKYFPTGSKDAPRFPTFLGFRDPKDM